MIRVLLKNRTKIKHIALRVNCFSLNCVVIFSTFRVIVFSMQKKRKEKEAIKKL